VLVYATQLYHRALYKTNKCSYCIAGTAGGKEAEGVLYGCETWSLTLREERKLRVFCMGVKLGR